MTYIFSIKSVVAFCSLTLALLCVSPPLYAATVNHCIECHSEINEDIISAFQSDVHAGAGLTCVDCHGGNAELDDENAMDPKYGFTPGTDQSMQPQFCGRCHSDPVYMRDFNPSLPTDQVDKYWTSIHGQRLRSGDTKVATCVSCHGAHGVLPPTASKSKVHPMNVPRTCAHCHANVDYMADYGIPTNQYSQYVDSSNVHGYALLVKRDLGAPACNDCHGNHGAAPPGLESVSQVCSHCHSMNGRLFRNSPHKDGFDAMGVFECAFCHQANPDINEPAKNIHTIVHPTSALIGTREGAVCIQCHDQGDDGWASAVSISLLHDSLDARLQRAHEILDLAQERGFEASDARWLLDSEVRQSVMELRTAIHSFDLNRYMPVYVKADTSLNQVLEAGYLAMEELGGRRVYALVMTILIGILIILLIVKMREIKAARKA